MFSVVLPKYVPSGAVVATPNGENVTLSEDENRTIDRPGMALPPTAVERFPEIVTVPPWGRDLGDAWIERFEAWGPNGEVTFTVTATLSAGA
ncbi:MAG: hypothetical protein A4E40_00185 [Methanoregulaceae archaeon PtaU1.Bin059]|nr:MAG: hypothetical protein A4E40_00185 [Methanoregulaceae archaeon PtaU1.Bin059]